MRRLALSLLRLQAAISSTVRKQPRQTSLLSRQQWRMQGEGTGLSDAVAGCCGGSGMDIDAGAGRCRSRLAHGSTPILAATAVMFAARVEGAAQLLPAAVVLAPLAAASLPVWRRDMRSLLVADLHRVGGRVARHRVELAGTGGDGALGAQPLHASVFGNQC
jgi:hypothetical protein